MSAARILSMDCVFRYTSINLESMLGDCAISMLIRRPHWHGSINKLLTTRESKVAELVGAAVPYEHFKKVSGVPATKAAIKRLNARLAARGAPATCAAAAPNLCMMR